MGQETVTLGGRSYRIGCGEGDEARLASLAADLETRLSGLKRQFGSVAEERLLLLAALLLTDELWDTRAALDAAVAEASQALRIATAPDRSTDKSPAVPAPREPNSGAA